MSTVVVDASVLAAALLPGEHTHPARTALAGADELAAPEHLGIEVLSVLRRHARATPELGPVCETARQALADLAITPVPLRVLHERIWELRATLTAYDAAYLAAAEHRQAELLTYDNALLTHPDRRCPAWRPAGA